MNRKEKNVNRQDFKDQLTVALIPMFTQMMVRIEQPSGIVGAGAEQNAKGTFPPAEQVAALALGYAERAAAVRDAHLEAVKETKKKEAEERARELVRASGNGGNRGTA